ncbi:MAG: hypothetical protein WAT12_03515 [Candidatus Nitrotoga sp.]
MVFPFSAYHINAQDHSLRAGLLELYFRPSRPDYPLKTRKKGVSRFDFLANQENLITEATLRCEVYGGEEFNQNVSQLIPL